MEDDQKTLQIGPAGVGGCVSNVRIGVLLSCVVSFLFGGVARASSNIGFAVFAFLFVLMCSFLLYARLNLRYQPRCWLTRDSLVIRRGLFRQRDQIVALTKVAEVGMQWDRGTPGDNASWHVTVILLSGERKTLPGFYLLRNYPGKQTTWDTLAATDQAKTATLIRYMADNARKAAGLAPLPVCELPRSDGILPRHYWSTDQRIGLMTSAPGRR